MDKHNPADIEAFKAETGLEDSVVQELYSVFLEELDSERQRLIESAGRQDYEMLGRVVHNIKGISGSYMLRDVSDFSTQLNAQLKQSNFEGVEDSVRKLSELISEADSEIRAYIKA